MQRYLNLGGDSGVRMYETGPDTIRIRFSDRSWYLYTVASTGAVRISEMRRLADAGRGLNSYVNRCVGSDYASKGRW
jgi:hypothetical protein